MIGLVSGDISRPDHGGNRELVELIQVVEESLQNLTTAEDDLKEGTREVEDIGVNINTTKDLHTEVLYLTQISCLQLLVSTQQLSAFASWLTANSLCHGERVNMQDIKLLWTHAR